MRVREKHHHHPRFSKVERDPPEEGPSFDLRRRHQSRESTFFETRVSVIEDDRNKPRCFRSPRPPPERASQSRLLRRQRQPLPGDEKKLRGASQVRAPSSFDAFFDSFFFKCVRNRFPFWILPFYPLFSLDTNRLVLSILLGSLPLSF